MCSATKNDSKPRFSASWAIAPGLPDCSVRKTNAPIFIDKCPRFMVLPGGFESLPSLAPNHVNRSRRELRGCLFTRLSLDDSKSGSDGNSSSDELQPEPLVLAHVPEWAGVESGFF